MPKENIESLLLITTLCPFFLWSFFLFWKLTMTRSSLMSKSLRRSRAVSEKRLPARNMRHNPKASSQFSSVPRLRFRVKRLTSSSWSNDVERGSFCTGGLPYRRLTVLGAKRSGEVPFAQAFLDWRFTPSTKSRTVWLL